MCQKSENLRLKIKLGKPSHDEDSEFIECTLCKKTKCICKAGASKPVSTSPAAVSTRKRTAQNAIPEGAAPPRTHKPFFSSEPHETKSATGKNVTQNSPKTSATTKMSISSATGSPISANAQPGVSSRQTRSKSAKAARSTTTIGYDGGNSLTISRDQNFINASVSDPIPQVMQQPATRPSSASAKTISTSTPKAVADATYTQVTASSVPAVVKQTPQKESPKATRSSVASPKVMPTVAAAPIPKTSLPQAAALQPAGISKSGTASSVQPVVVQKPISKAMASSVASPKVTPTVPALIPTTSLPQAAAPQPVGTTSEPGTTSSVQTSVIQTPQKPIVTTSSAASPKFTPTVAAPTLNSAEHHAAQSPQTVVSAAATPPIFPQVPNSAKLEDCAERSSFSTPSANAPGSISQRLPSPPLPWDYEPLPPPRIQEILCQIPNVEAAWCSGQSHTRRALDELGKISADAKSAIEAADLSSERVHAATLALETATQEMKVAQEQEKEAKEAARLAIGRREEVMRKNLTASMFAQRKVSSGISKIMRDIKQYGVELTRESEKKVNGREDEEMDGIEFTGDLSADSEESRCEFQ